jgi:glutathione synthase/RimK-type ligase-like ATP-grasp enzyme
MPRIVIATSADYPDLAPADQLYRTALRQRGAAVGVGVWSEGSAPFAAADLVVIRSTWGYYRDLGGYRRWLDALERSGVAVVNPLSLLRWNLEKTYLGELGAAGIPIPAQHVLPRERQAAHDVLAATGWRQAVAKPSVGASGYGIMLVEPGSLDTVWDELAAAVAPHRLMLQEYVPEIRTAGQVSYVFIGGDFAHATRHRPRAGEFRINSRFQPERTVMVPSAAEIAAAARVVAALPVAPLFARIDMVQQAGRQLLLEAEVHEPGLHFDLVPTSADLLARETLRWLQARAERVA